jgi:hypothetical protein
MACTCAPALLQLRKEINAKWPDRDKASDGCCGDDAHAARKSDHNPDADGYAHALDIDENLTDNVGSLAFLVPVLLADSRTKYVIYEGEIHYPPATTKPYTGVNAHKQHLHLSIKGTATFETRPWLAVEKPDPAPIEEDDMPGPAIVRDSKGRRILFDRGPDLSLWWQVDGKPWGPTSLTNPLGSAPSVELTANGVVEIAAYGTDGKTSFVCTWNGAVFSPWVPTGPKG